MYLKMVELGLAQRASFRTVSHAPPTGEQGQTTTTTWQRSCVLPPDRIVLLIHAAITGTNAQKRVSLDSPRNKPGTVPTIVLTVNFFLLIFNLSSLMISRFNRHHRSCLTCFPLPLVRLTACIPSFHIIRCIKTTHTGI